MALKNLKRLILFSGILSLFSTHVSGQYLRNHMITAQVNGGFLQWETSFSYQYSFASFSSYEIKERRNQLFVGAEIGTTKLNSNLFGPGGLIGNSFQMHAKGNHLSFLLTNVITKPKKGKKEGFRYNYVTLKFTINKFNNVKSSYDIDTYNEDDDVDGGLETCRITDETCKSFDLQLLIDKNVILNSFNYFKVGFYFGLSARNTTGTMHITRSTYPNRISNYSYTLNPLILGFSLGYQINLGKQKK